MRTTATVAVAALAAASLTACVSGGAEDEPRPVVTLFAAASLTDAFVDISRRFEADRPGVTVELNFAGSSALAAQIVEGAPVDVFAAADQASMDEVVAAGAAVEPTTFALNQLVIAVPEGNPDDVTSLADLAGLDIAVCAEEVPCGAAAAAAAGTSGIDLAPITYGPDVRTTLQTLILGEVDAAIVYRTDAIAAADKVDAVEFPESAEAVNAYPIAALEDAQNPELAAAFAEYVLTDDSRAILESAGFRQPAEAP